MRALCMAVGLSLAVAAPALACDFHEGGEFSRYAQYSGYETYEQMKAREAQLLAEREKAMEDARQAFLARFDIKADDSVQLAAASTDTKPTAVNADRSARADSPTR